ncbi:hypothetical protein [Streptomyces sp. 6-11-2]|uniref:hypothetical protein n=1 Tax=Streptomyces sp. 6-11-2 TaxID=2585753 RepID=UPI0011412DB9|nr:hypothetical protein [Streptomyces sp. 6-11-2]GED90753.1 hypothetical protein TNCT6_78380 [Streptomyces sp. 6-11-2]
MPLSAIHPEHSVLDLTLEGLGCEGRITWKQIHRARPRVPLTCPEREWGLHPKVSPHGARPVPGRHRARHRAGGSHHPENR